MSSFTKTIIVDLDHDEIEGQYYQTIEKAAKYLRDHLIGGVIIVESGTYDFDGTGYKTTVSVPSNTTLIGRGNVVVNIKANVSAFTNSSWAGGNKNITISGFKIVVSDDINENSYTTQLIDLRNSSNCTLEKLYITTTNPQNEVYENETSNTAIYLHGDTNSTVNKCIIKGGAASKGFRTGIFLFHGYGHNVTLNTVKECQTNIMASNSERGLVKNNIITGAIGKIYASEWKYALNISLEQCKNFIIHGNQINETDSTPGNPTGSHGIYPSGCEGIIISGNIVYGNHGNGIKPRYAGSDEVPVVDKNYCITGNVCVENGLNGEGNGINLQGHSQRMVLFGNVCYNNANNGIRLQIENKVAGARAHDNLAAGNVAILHTGDAGDDAPISIEDPSNCCTCNLTGKL